LKYGGVHLTHEDENNEPYCYDDHIEKIRVTKIYGYGKSYIHPLQHEGRDVDDFLFSKIGWEN
jgi:hypothetical protein